MRWILSPVAAALLLAGSGCADQTNAPATATSELSVWEKDTPWGSGPAADPTSIYDPSRLNDPSLIEDQPHNRGGKG
jgi:hypothetical protein